MTKPRWGGAMLGLVLVSGAGAMVSAQDYPAKPIRIVTSPAGGGSDFTARLIAQGVAGPLGQQVVVDNRTALQAAEAVSKAAPDGYSLLVGGGVLWIGSLLRPSPFDAVRDFTPITMTERTVHVVTVHPSLPVKNVKELIALAKARPGELNYGSAGAGSAQHLGVELFKAMTGVNIVHVPYKGGGPALTALVGGEMQMTIYDSGGVGPHIKAGRLRGLAVTSAEPSALVPGLPTVAASGVPDYESVGLTGLFAPAKTPTAIVAKLNQEVVRVLNRPDVKEKFLSAGSEVVGSTPEQSAATIKSDIVKWGKVIKDANIKAE